MTQPTEEESSDFLKKPDLSGLGEKKKDIPGGLWQKCPGCGAVVHELQLAENLRVCPKCDHHFTITAQDRIDGVVDEGSFVSMDDHLQTINALHFKDYSDKIRKYRKATGLNDAVLTGRAKIERCPILLAAMDFRFLGASMGSVVGEKITRAIEVATAERSPVIIFSASGGARMHEGILSLMQMAKTSGALARHHEARLGYISVLTHPTTGGVTASFATLGDVIIAEPGCMIGFAGPRVVKETTHQNLPPGFQTAEFMLEHGLVDFIVHRRDMRKRLSQLLGYMATAA
ncbi:MAG: acetyl-CoA carboxylase, carboxyltransferase subunit beta [Verrucomicrobiales bacterium]